MTNPPDNPDNQRNDASGSRGQRQLPAIALTVGVCLILAGLVFGLYMQRQASDAAQAEPSLGKAVYERHCFSCHASGIAGAPRTGDVEAWAPLLAKGDAALLRATIDGVPPGMPAKGLCMACSEQALAEAIDYMVASD